MSLKIVVSNLDIHLRKKHDYLILKIFKWKGNNYCILELITESAET